MKNSIRWKPVWSDCTASRMERPHDYELELPRGLQIGTKIEVTALVHRNRETRVWEWSVNDKEGSEQDRLTAMRVARKVAMEVLKLLDEKA